MSYFKVLITTAGIGTRLGEATKFTNKSLLRVGNKPIISYIIESYPENIEIIISVGYYAEHIKEFVELAYPNRKIEFVLIDKFEGVGSSMAYSILKAKEMLQCPFIIHTGDTIVFDEIPLPDNNWNGGGKGENNSLYRTFSVLGGEIKTISEKGNLESDFIDIGICGIKDYKEFWKILEKLYLKNKNKSDLCECHVLNEMINNNILIKLKEFTDWYDAGSVDGLNKIRKKIPPTVEILDKNEESIFIFDDFVIKFFFDKEIIKKRIIRSDVLSGLIPKIQNYRNNFYRYKYQVGDLFSKIVDEENLIDFLRWSKNNLWKENKEVSENEFKKICKCFYFDKTIERLEKFKDITLIKDSENKINGVTVPTVKKMLSMIDFNWLCGNKQYLIHGDYVLDNILKTVNGYCLLDWRQDFGGLTKTGDIYYDLAKLNHNFTINHEIVIKDFFTIDINKNNEVKCDIYRKENLVQCQKKFFEFLFENNFDINKVNILTSIIWLNMSPLHTYPFNVFMYYFGKLNLWKAINSNFKIIKQDIKGNEVNLNPKNFILDVDGVFTDGKFFYTKEGKVMKMFGPEDNDALSLLKDKLYIHAITGDKNGYLITKKRLDDMKIPLDLVSTFDRIKWIKNRFDPKETIYMGDGIFDPLVFKEVGYSIAPNNSFYKTKELANFVTNAKGSEGAVAEACLHIMEKFFEPFNLFKHEFRSGSGVWIKSNSKKVLKK